MARPSVRQPMCGAAAELFAHRLSGRRDSSVKSPLAGCPARPVTTDARPLSSETRPNRTMGDLQPLYGVAWRRDFGTQRGHVYLQADTPALLMAAATKLGQPLKTDGCIFKIKA